MLATSQVPRLSHTWYTNESVPEKSVSGTYSQSSSPAVPATLVATLVRLPFCGAMTISKTGEPDPVTPLSDSVTGWSSSMFTEESLPTGVGIVTTGAAIVVGGVVVARACVVGADSGTVVEEVVVVVAGTEVTLATGIVTTGAPVVVGAGTVVPMGSSSANAMSGSGTEMSSGTRMPAPPVTTAAVAPTADATTLASGVATGAIGI